MGWLRAVALEQGQGRDRILSSLETVHIVEGSQDWLSLQRSTEQEL